jgi:monoamine oxidase
MRVAILGGGLTGLSTAWKLIRTAYAKFYFRPRYLIRRALALRSFEEFTRYLRYVRRVYQNVGRYVHHQAPA